MINAGSSNGRTPGFGPGNRGSNPCPAELNFMALLESKDLPIGWNAPDFELKGTDDKKYNIDNFKSKDGLLLVFTCNHCPYAKASWPILVDLYSQYRKNIEFAAINSNDAREYPDDSFEQMKIKADEWGVKFPYLVDDTQKTAKDYFAQCTPDVYLFKNNNNNLELFYHGRINDNWKQPEQVKSNDLSDAIDALINNQESPQNQKPSMGCSIKWKE